ncbi:MAG: hypothetical protein LKI24_09570 [Acidipropionibacterium sp.]|jgi:hypothetical protein|nr:hypothetical protein [Acidipropionibacterium sp.]
MVIPDDDDLDGMDLPSWAQAAAEELATMAGLSGASSANSASSAIPSAPAPSNAAPSSAAPSPAVDALGLLRRLAARTGAHS